MNTKPCPNCNDGYEDNPPLRRCGVCHGHRRVADDRKKRSGIASGPSELKAHSAEARLCTAGQQGVL